VNRYFLGAYWSARRESIDECADRLLRFFAALTPCDPSLAQWFKLGRSRRQALQHSVDVADRKSLRELLERGRHWTDFDKRLIDDLGFSLALWNGADTSTSAQLTSLCGSYCDTAVNNVVLLLPHVLGRLSNAGRMRAVLAAAATAWEPDWAGIMSDDATATRRRDKRAPFVDWMLYVNHKWLPKVPQLAPPASSERLAGGTLIVVQPEVPDPSNEVHLENIRRVETALRSAWHVPKS
jgi:hypothetical protein